MSVLTLDDLDCRPRFATPRDPSRATLGPAIGAAAARLGRPFMPWQQYVADVIGEIDSDTGRLVYDEFGLTVPRQSGKSTFVLGKAVHRCSATSFFGGRQRVVYTAQTRNKAREKWEEDYAGDIERSTTFGPTVQAHKGNGNEHLRFANGSRFGIEATTEKAGHGSTIDEGYIDEAFAHVDNRLEQAFRPAMITRPNKQLGWLSTAGWLDGSPYLSGKVNRARDLVELHTRSGLAYFEWSAPEDADVDDEDVWRACMPALGHTIEIEAIRAEFRAMADNLNDFRRAYLNQWVRKNEPEESPLPFDSWSDGLDQTSTIVGVPTLAVEVPYDRSTGLLVVAGRRPDGDTHVEVVEGPAQGRVGTHWIPARVAEIVRAHGVERIILDAGGPAGEFENEIRSLVGRRVEVVTISGRQMGQACGSFAEAVRAGRVHHLGDEILDAGVRQATRKFVGDLWVWKRKGAGSEIAALIGATMATYLLDSAPAGRGKRSGVVV